MDVPIKNSIITITSPQPQPDSEILERRIEIETFLILFLLRGPHIRNRQASPPIEVVINMVGTSAWRFSCAHHIKVVLDYLLI